MGRPYSGDVGGTLASLRRTYASIMLLATNFDVTYVPASGRPRRKPDDT